MIIRRLHVLTMVSVAAIAFKVKDAPCRDYTIGATSHKMMLKAEWRNCSKIESRSTKVYQPLMVVEQM